VLRFLPGGVVVIDRSYRILTANPSARRLLGIRDVSSDLDFLHAVRGLPYSALRDAIDRLFRDRVTIVMHDMRLDTMISNEERYLTLTLVLMHMDAGQPDLGVISVADSTDQVQTERRLQAAQVEQKGIMDEVSAMNTRLSEMNKELQDVNEQLQATNEEMMLTQEELQATNEEFEATNEELQATNEELETNIEELQATNEELETTNEELQARTGELSELTRTLADEQARLHSVIAHAPFFAMLLRGPALLVEMISDRYALALDRHDPLGRPFADLFPDQSDLLRTLREMYQQDAPTTVGLVLPPLPGLAPAASGALFRYHLIPTHDSRRRIDGIVLYAEDTPA
jgi:two-component system CheB/CheR fusion protein